MSRIVTVTGEISSANLGFCHAHEHLSLAKGQSFLINPALCIDDPPRTLVELQSFRKAGGGGIVDAQPVGCGRDAQVLSSLSLQSGVAVIASTGFHKMQFYPGDHWIFSYSQAELTRVFVSELMDGMYLDCDSAPPTRQFEHRAGNIKAALDSGDVSPQYRKLFAAAAKAAVETKAPLMVHIEHGSGPTALADFLEDQGVDLQRVIFCHMDRMFSGLSLHKALCARGITMEYDTIARPKYHSDTREAEIVAEMVSGGFAGHILMGLDVTRERMVSYGGGVGLAYIKEQFLSILRAHGVCGAIQDQIFVQNPARIFTVRF